MKATDIISRMHMNSYLLHLQGIGLMITTTLLANGASVYIIGPKKADLDKWVVSVTYDAMVLIAPAVG